MRPTDRQRAALVDTLRRKGIDHPVVLDAVARVPRHLFIPDLGLQPEAYHDVALPIGMGQTISQPFTVATMTALLDPQPGERVLEVGTGSGYQAAVLSEMGARVFSVERHRPLLDRTAPLLDGLGYRVRTRLGDGTEGWLAFAPFDGVVVTAGGREVPPALLDQLRPPKPGRPHARLVIPLGPPDRQTLHRLTRTPDGVVDEAFGDCVFVPLVGGS